MFKESGSYISQIESKHKQLFTKKLPSFYVERKWVPAHSVIFAAMLQKNIERFVIAFYTLCINIVSLFSPTSAAKWAYKLFTTPPRPKKLLQHPTLPQATPIDIELAVCRAHGYRWGSPHPGNKKVLIAHGFRSQALKFEHMVSPLLAIGYTVYAFDAPAHGKSGGKVIQPVNYCQMIMGIEEKEGPFDAFIGHSLGGLALGLAMEQVALTLQRKWVFIAPATESHRSIENFFHIIQVNQRVKNRFYDYLAEISHFPIEYYSLVRILKENNMHVLWIHDKDDSICPLEDVQPLINKHLPHIQFHITEGLGHNKIYRDKRVIDEIVSFLGAD